MPNALATRQERVGEGRGVEVAEAEAVEPGGQLDAERRVELVEHPAVAKAELGRDWWIDHAVVMREVGVQHPEHHRKPVILVPVLPPFRQRRDDAGEVDDGQREWSREGSQPKRGRRGTTAC
jgi:hypothetical protein